MSGILLAHVALGGVVLFRQGHVVGVQLQVFKCLLEPNVIRERNVDRQFLRIKKGKKICKIETLM